MSGLIVLVHAPVLGPASWRPVGTELSKSGYQVAVPALGDFCSAGAPYAPKLIEMCAEQIAAAAGQARPGRARASQPKPERVVLVLHSGAGAFAGHLASAVRAASVAVIFADAGLPARSGAAPVVDGGFLPYLRKIAKDGIVPPWHEWWPGADPAEIFPNEAAQAAVFADARPLPLAFFEEALPPVLGGPPLGGAGYLLFSDSYRPEAEKARRQGWPVTELAGSHLYQLAKPAEVAAAIASLDKRLRTP